MLRTAIALCVLAGLPLAAQQNQPADPAADQKKIRLEGKVISAAGEPLSRATVRLSPGGNINIIGGPRGGGPGGGPPGSFSSSTDEQGKFVFEGVTPNTYQMTAERNGFVTQRYGATTPTGNGTPLALKEGDKLLTLEIKMVRQGIVAGRVTDRDGEAVPNMQVRVSRYQYSGGKRQMVMIGNATTDDRGDYRVANLPPGRYFVIADTRPAGARGGPPPPTNQPQAGRAGVQAESNVTTYYPGSLDTTGAVQLDVPAGSEQLGVNIQMRREKVFSIRGAVADQTTGKAAGAAMLFPVPSEWAAGTPPEGMPQITRSAADGSFEIRELLPGTYTIQGIAGGTLAIGAGGEGGFMMMMRLAPGAGPESNATGRIDVTVPNADVNGVGLLLTGGGEITGTIRMDEGELKDAMGPQPTAPAKPPPGMPPLPGMAGGVGVRLGVDGVGVNVPFTSADDKGAFTLTGANPGTYYVNVTGLQNTYVKQMRFAGQDITRRPMVLTPSGGALDIVVSKKVAELSGSVTNSRGEAMAGVTISMWPKTPNEAISNGGVRIAVSDQNGAFKFSNAIPGDYYVVAWEDLPDPGLGQYTDFLAKFTSEASPVKLDENGKPSVQVNLVGRDKITAQLANLR